MADTKIWDGSQWVSLMGPQGPQGDPGKDGSGVTIKGTATAYPPAAAPTVGDMWIVGDPVPAGSPAGTEAGDGLVWTGTGWENVGGIRGPAGKDGAAGADGAPGRDGAAGADGKGFNPTGDWQADAEYALGDVVMYDGSSYVLVDVPPAGTKPDDAGAGAFWNLLAAKGADGASGSAGQKGDTGADGRSVEVYVQPSQPASPVRGDIWIEP